MRPCSSLVNARHMLQDGELAYMFDLRLSGLERDVGRGKAKDGNVTWEGSMTDAASSS